MKLILGIIGILVIITAMWFGGKALGVIDKVTEPDHIINSYEEYEEIYAACQKLCDDIRNYNTMDVDETSGFSKQERILNIENNFNRWIREYNAKSRMVTRNLWKSESLPYKLDRDDFHCE